jgi:cyanophycinase
MTGIVAFVGGGEFEQTEALDRDLLGWTGASEVLVVPTADAFERPQRAVERAVSWFAGLGVAARGLDLLRRPDASSPGVLEALRASRLTYLVGDSPMHLRSVLKDTPAWAALAAAAGTDDRAVVAAGPAAMAMCDPMTDPRGGAFTLGLGLVRPLAVVPGADAWSHDRLHRTLKLAGAFPVVTLATGAALVSRDGAWSCRGDVTIHARGALADVDVLPPAT